MSLEEQREGLKAAHDVLRRVEAIDADDELLRPPRDERRFALEHRGVVPQPPELAGVDADRMRDDSRGATMLGNEALDAGEERAAPALGVEADDVVREQSLVDRDAQLFRQRVP